MYQISLHPHWPSLLFVWLMPFFCGAQTLYPGDLAVLGISANTFSCGGPAGGDEVSFVCFKDIQPGTTIDLTDNGWERCTAGRWGDSEGTIRFTRTGTTIPAGTVITYLLSSTNAFGTYTFVSPDADWTAQTLSGSLLPTAVNLNSGGDQLYFLQGGTWDNTGPNNDNKATYSGEILFGFNTKANWAANCTTNPTQNSNLHPDLIPCFHMEPNAAADFAKYTGPLTPTDRLGWVNRIKDKANWSFFGDCGVYLLTPPLMTNGLKLEILPTQIGITGGDPGVCPGDTAQLNMLLPTTGAPFSVTWTDGSRIVKANGVSQNAPLTIVPYVSAIYAIIGLTDNNGCTIQGDLNTDFFLEAYPADSIFFNDTTCIASNAGITIERYTNRFGCDSVHINTVYFDNALCAVTLDAKKSDITCFGENDGRIDLIILSGVGPFTIKWEEQTLGTLGTVQVQDLQTIINIDNLPKGKYRITITDANGISTFFERTIKEPPPLSGQIGVLSNYNGFEISCFGRADGRVSSAINGGTPGYAFQWSSGDTKATVDSLNAGDYFLTVTDDQGCTLQLSVRLDEPPKFNAGIRVSGELCFGKNDAYVIIDSLSGGLPPYMTSFDNMPFSNQMAWTGLMPGSYLLTVKDANDCSITYGTILPTGLEFNIEAGPDTLIFAGDSLLFTLNSNQPLESISFSPSNGVQVLSAETAVFTNRVSTQYFITATDLNGCVATDNITIKVKKERSIYVPNVFSPTATNETNQSLTVYGSRGIDEVAVFRVYDRFGELVFERKNFAVNDPVGNWDGTIGNREGAVGVYVWYAIVHFTDGREEVVKGSVLLAK